MGWFIVPKTGEQLNWAMYEFPERKRTETVETKVAGRANVHGIEGFEIDIVEHNPTFFNSVDEQKTIERKFVSQLTDMHSRILDELGFWRE